DDKLAMKATAALGPSSTSESYYNIDSIYYKITGQQRRAALILANVSVFSPKPSMHYLNITMKNVVKIFRKDTVLGSSSG
ncbi:GPCR kinase, partial [Tanacetum coccineum]